MQIMGQASVSLFIQKKGFWDYAIQYVERIEQKKERERRKERREVCEVWLGKERREERDRV